MEAAALDKLVEKGRLQPDVALAIGEALDITIKAANLVTVPILDARFASHVDKVSDRFVSFEEGMNGRFVASDEKMNAGFVSFEERMNGRFVASDEKMNAGFVSFEERMNARFVASDEKMNARFVSFEERMNGRFVASDEKMNARFVASDEKMNARFETIEGRINSLMDTVHSTKVWAAGLGMTLAIALFGALAADHQWIESREDQRHDGMEARWRQEQTQSEARWRQEQAQSEARWRQDFNSLRVQSDERQARIDAELKQIGAAIDKIRLRY